MFVCERQCWCCWLRIGASKVLITTGIFRLPHTASQLQLARLPSIGQRFTDVLVFFLSCDARLLRYPNHLLFALTRNAQRNHGYDSGAHKHPIKIRPTTQSPASANCKDEAGPAGQELICIILFLIIHYNREPRLRTPNRAS